MQIGEATSHDAEDIRNLYLQAFDDSEARKVSDLAVGLLKENHSVKTISLVAIINTKIVGHIAFSPVLLAATNAHLGYILAPLAVSADFQHRGIGSSLIRHGLDMIYRTGSFIVFVYGDPDYYSRFGFRADLARHYVPPHTLRFPKGWQALKLKSDNFPEGGKIACVDSLNDPELW